MRDVMLMVGAIAGYIKYRCKACRKIFWYRKQTTCPYCGSDRIEGYQ